MQVRHSCPSLRSRRCAFGVSKKQVSSACSPSPRFSKTGNCSVANCSLDNPRPARLFQLLIKSCPDPDLEVRNVPNVLSVLNPLQISALCLTQKFLSCRRLAIHLTADCKSLRKVSGINFFLKPSHTRAGRRAKVIKRPRYGFSSGRRDLLSCPVVVPLLNVQWNKLKSWKKFCPETDNPEPTTSAIERPDERRPYLFCHSRKRL